MRVVTLLPAATEIVAALGAADLLVGVSHECDHPAAVAVLPRVTATPIDPSWSGARVDAEVRALRDAGRPVILVDAPQLRALAPDLVVTQGLCDVCAVSDGAVHRLASALVPPPRVLSLAAQDLAGIRDDVRQVAAALGREPAGAVLVAALDARLAALRARAGGARRPRVVCIEWLEPLYLAGHWVPELVAAAGGEDVGAAPGEPSRRRGWAEVAALVPDLVVVMLCGYDVARAERELAACDDPAARAFLARVPVWVLDGNAYTSRPGPRVVEGAERLQAAVRGEPASGLVRWQPPRAWRAA